MADVQSNQDTGQRFRPMVSSQSDMREFTVRALVIGLILVIVGLVTRVRIRG